jgi:hypothetical protein
MPIEIIEGSIEHVPQIYDCSWRAFGNDLLQKAMFPIADDDIEGLQKLKEFRLLKLTKRLSKPGCHTFVAIDKEIDNGSRVLGYAVWYEEAVFEITNGERKPPDKVEDQPEIPKSINVKLLKRIEKIIDGTRKEFLKELDGKMWCKFSELLLRTKLIQATIRPHDARRGSRFWW